MVTREMKTRKTISSPSKRVLIYTLMMMIVATMILIMMMMILITNGFLPSNLRPPEQLRGREGFECGPGEGQRGGGRRRRQVARYLNALWKKVSMASHFPAG